MITTVQYWIIEKQKLNEHNKLISIGFYIQVTLFVYFLSFSDKSLNCFTFTKGIALYIFIFLDKKIFNLIIYRHKITYSLC